MTAAVKTAASNQVPFRVDVITVHSHKDNHFFAVSVKALKEYKEFICSQHEAATMAKSSIENNLITVKQELQDIQSYDATRKQELLEKDVVINKEMLDEYVNSIKDDAAFYASVESEVRTPAELEQSLLFTELREKILEVAAVIRTSTTRSIKQLSTLADSLIVTDNITPEEVEQRIESRIQILKNKLEVYERDMATQQSQLLHCENQLNEVNSILQVLSEEVAVNEQ